MTLQTDSLPKGWVCVALGEVVQPSDEKIDPAKAQNTPYIGLEHIGKDNGKLLSHGYANDVRSTKTIFYAGDLLYGRLRPYLNKAHVADFDGICSTDILIFPASSHLSNKFLVCRILCSDFVSFASHNMSGVQHPRVSFNTISRFPILLPPLPEQHRIVARIEELFTRLDAGIEALKKIRAQLKHYRQSVLKHAFEGKLTEEWRQAHKHELEPTSVLLERIKQERPKAAKGKYKELPPLDTSALPELPDGWVWTRVGELFDISYGLSESLSKTEADTQADVPVIRIPNITEFGSLDLTQLKYFPLEKARKENLAINRGDVLFNWRNAPKWIGRSAVFDRDGEFVNASFLLKLRPCLQGYSHFASYYLNHLRINGYFLTKVSNAVNQANFNATMTARVEIPFPAILEQHRIVEEIERRFSVATEIERTVDHSLKQAERLRQSILNKAFEGKLVPQNPNDEPAGKLLERTRQKRARQQAERKPAKSSRNKSNTKQMRLV